MFVTFPEANFERYDILVAGSGFAAVSVARGCVARGKTVLLIESGRAEFDGNLQLSLAQMEGRGHYDGAHWQNHWMRALGGTSALWQGWVAPLLERNLADWPISRDDLEPWLRIAMADLGRPAEALDWARPFVEGFESRPISRGHALNLSLDAPETFSAVDGIDTLLATSVVRLHPREDRRGVVALDLAPLGDGERRVALREGQAVVLAAGGMGNPQILLESDAQGGAAVGDERGQVGRHLMEHPHIYDCARVVLPADQPVAVPGESFGEFAMAVSPDDATHAALGGRDVSLEFEPDTANPEDAIERHVLNRCGPGAQIYAITVRAEMAADPANRVVLTGLRNGAGLRRLRCHCVIGADDLRAIDGALQRLGEAIARRGPGRLRIDNAALYGDILGGGHIMGTTRMGASPADGVVDVDCRVHGYENLYVAGSSVFRTGGYANPTLNLMALAARLGDRLGGTA